MKTIVTIKNKYSNKAVAFVMSQTYNKNEILDIITQYNKEYSKVKDVLNALNLHENIKVVIADDRNHTTVFV